MADSARNARFYLYNNFPFTNVHQNVQKTVARSYDAWNPPKPNTDAFGDMKLTVAMLQTFVADAAANNVQLRAFGGQWSLSEAAIDDGWLINTQPLNIVFKMAAGDVSPDYTNPPRNLVFAQCGNSVQEINQFLEDNMLALKTSGASDGQTILGALTTGTHGSAIDFGAMQDFVAGMHVIVSPTRHVWIERKSAPVVSQAFLNKLGAELVTVEGSA